MKSIIITGSCGLVRTRIIKIFLNKKFNVIGIDNNFRKFFFLVKMERNWVKKDLIKFQNYNHFNLDIRNKFSVEKKIFKKFKNISGIIHCAAQPSI